MAKATERMFLPLMRLDMPEIKDINLPMEGVFHNCCLISIKKSYPGHAKKIIHGLWGKGQMMFAKLLRPSVLMRTVWFSSNQGSHATNQYN